MNSKWPFGELSLFELIIALLTESWSTSVGTGIWRTTSWQVLFLQRWPRFRTSKPCKLSFSRWILLHVWFHMLMLKCAPWSLGCSHYYHACILLLYHVFKSFNAYLLLLVIGFFFWLCLVTLHGTRLQGRYQDFCIGMKSCNTCKYMSNCRRSHLHVLSPAYKFSIKGTLLYRKGVLGLLSRGWIACSSCG